MIPEESAENRVTANGRLGVYRTTDGGASWELIVAEEPAWAAVLREALAWTPRRVYAGHAERPGLRAPARRGRRGRRGTCRRSSRSKPDRRGRGVVLLPVLLATEAGGRKRFEVDAATLGDALRALPVRGLVLDEHGELRPLVNVYVDGERTCATRGGLDDAARRRR